MAITTQIPLQEKIAELESRIEKLERAANVHTQKQTKVEDFTKTKEWHGLWQNFDALFKRVFK